MKNISWLAYGAVPTLVIGASLSSCQSLGSSSQPPCRMVDMTDSVAPSEAKLLLENSAAWGGTTIECKLGDYLIDVPVEGARGELFIARNGRPFLIIDNDSRVMFDDGGQRMIVEWNRGTDPERGDALSYTGFDSARNAFVTNMDIGPDGSLDMRWIEVAGQPTRAEARIAERWLEIVNQDGQMGTVVDGQFMSIAEARARLEGN